MPYTTRNQVKKAFPAGIAKLEIGSGNNPEPGYVHVDIQKGLKDLDILADVRTLPIPDNFVTQEIRAVHIMEHFCHPQYAGKSLQKKYGTITEILTEMYRVLKPGAKFKLVTPDFDKIAQSTARGRVPYEWLQRWTVGGHLNEYDVHHWLWTKADAVKWFSEVGFTNLTDWNPVQGRRAVWKLNWRAVGEVGNPDWHTIEWYHWLFFEGTKP